MSENAFAGIVDFLRDSLGESRQAQVAEVLGIQQPQVSQYIKSAPKRASWWKKIAGHVYGRGYADGQQAAATELMNSLVEGFGRIPQSDLARWLGVTQQAISNWLRGSAMPTKRNFERLLSLHVAHLVEPIVEFRKIAPIRSGASWRLTGDGRDGERLRQLLDGQVGIYVFYDSAGRVTYLGKTERDLWYETRQQLKAKVNRPFYRPRLKKDIRQGEVARFMSAYRVRVPAAIHNLEVLMLRAFPNDLANTNIGEFKKGL